MDEVSYSDDTLEIGNETVSFRHSIDDHICIGDFIVVLLRVPPNVDDPHNIVCIDRQGTIIWEIDTPDEGAYEQPYHFIKMCDGRLIATNWDGYEYRVNVDTGAVTRHKKIDK